MTENTPAVTTPGTRYLVAWGGDKRSEDALKLGAVLARTFDAVEHRQQVGDDRLDAALPRERALAATAVAGWLGTVCFRAHDVRATRRVVDMVASIRGDRPPMVARCGVRD